VGCEVLVGADVNLWASATCCGETCETLAVASKEVGLAASADGAVWIQFGASERAAGEKYNVWLES
jgi:hypothetical protein